MKSRLEAPILISLFRSAVIFFVFLAGLTSSANAELITFNFTAKFDRADLVLLNAGLSTTDLVGSYTFDPNTADAQPGVLFVGDYQDAVSAVSFSNIAGTVRGSATGGDIQIQNDGGEGDSYFMHRLTGITSPPLGAIGTNLLSLSLVMNDPTGTALDSIALPTAPPDPNDFGFTRRIELRYDVPAPSGDTAQAIYELTSLTSAVPATFTVNSTTDTVDASPGDGVCADVSGNCTLRAAIMETNALTGADIIDVPAGTYILSIEGRGEDASFTGGLDVTDDLTINGAGDALTIIDANKIDGVLRIFHSITEIYDVTITGGDVNGISNTLFATLILTDSIISGNGGYGISSSGAITVTNSEISNNHSGGIFISDIATLTNCTISNNHNSGITVEDEIWSAGDLTLANCTISSNHALGDEGGGISFVGGFGSASATSKNSIVANNSGGDCSRRITSLDYNLDSDGTCNFTQPNDLPNTDPLLGPLADSGGPTETHALLAGSPAIDAGEEVCLDAKGDLLETDQRGRVRPVDGSGAGVAVCDIGAYEFYPILNDLVSLDDVDTAFNPADSRAQAGVFTISATFTNTSSTPIHVPYFQVAELSAGNVLVNADGAPGSVGSTLTADVGGDDVLAPGESFTTDFEIGLETANRFRFFVDLLGEPLQ